VKAITDGAFCLVSNKKTGSETLGIWNKQTACLGFEVHPLGFIFANARRNDWMQRLSRSRAWEKNT
jgi:hypothetical protein